MVFRPVRRRDHSQPAQLTVPPAASTSNVQYSENWAGAVLTEADVCVIPIHDLP